MADAVRVILFPFIVLYHVASQVFGALSWIAGKVSLPKGGDTFGDSTWASLKQLKAGKHLAPGGFPVGKVGKHLIYTDPEKSALIQAQAGYGKSNTMGMTLLTAEREDVVSYDPAGQHYKKFATSLIDKGYDVRRIDLDDPAHGEHFDPVWFLDGSTNFTIDRDLKTLADLISGKFEEGKNTGPHFKLMGAKLIAGALVYLRKHKAEQANIYEVARIYLMKSGDEQKAIFKLLMESGNDTAMLAVNAFQQVGDRERGSFISTLTNTLEVWTWPLYREVCTWNRQPETYWSWEQLWQADKPQAVFVTGGLGSRQSVEDFLRVFFGVCAASRARSLQRWGDFKRPLKLLIDEADSIGGCEPISRVITELRKARMQVFLAYQSISQLYSNFGTTVANTIIDNVEILSTGGIKDLKELQRLSQLIGQRTVTARSFSEDRKSETETGRPLVPVEEIYRLPRDELIGLLGPLPVRMKQVWRIKGDEVVY